MYDSKAVGLRADRFEGLRWGIGLKVGFRVRGFHSIIPEALTLYLKPYSPQAPEPQ